MLIKVIPSNCVDPWGGAAFVLGNLLFLVNKFGNMSRLFLDRWVPDVISQKDPVLIFCLAAVSVLLRSLLFF